MAARTRRQFTLTKLSFLVVEDYRRRKAREVTAAEAPPAHPPPAGGLVQLPEPAGRDATGARFWTEGEVERLVGW